MVRRGFKQEFLEFFREVRRNESAACGAALESGKRVIVENIASNPIFEGTEAQKVLLRAGIRAVQSTPLFSRSSELYGMLSTHFRSSRLPSERGLRFLDLLARQAADFIERLNDEAIQQREKLNQAAKLSNALAHELNNPVQALTNALYLLSKHESINEDVQQLLQLAHQQLQRVRGSLREMLAMESRVSCPISTEVRELFETMHTAHR